MVILSFPNILICHLFKQHHASVLHSSIEKWKYTVSYLCSRPSSSSATYGTFVFFCMVFMLLSSTFSLSAETTYVSFNWSLYWFSLTFLLAYLQTQLKRNNDTSFHFILSRNVSDIYYLYAFTTYFRCNTLHLA